MFNVYDCGTAMSFLTHPKLNNPTHLDLKSRFYPNLKVVTMEGQEVGKITKQWSGIVRWLVNYFLI